MLYLDYAKKIGDRYILNFRVIEQEAPMLWHCE